MLARARKAARDREAGFTVPELATATIALLIVGAAVLTLIVVAARQYTDQEDRVTTTDDARNALLRMTSEIRDGGAVTYVDQNTVQAEVRHANGTLRAMTFECQGASGSGGCVRTDDATGDAVEIVSGVTNDDPFRLIAGSDAEPGNSLGGAIEITLMLELEQAGNPLELTSAVRPRNCSTDAGVINPCA